MVKAHWLVFTVSLWIVTPVMLAIYAEISEPLFRWMVTLLAVSMTCRAVVELYLCMIVKKWKVVYGLAHNFVHAFILIACITAQLMANDSLLTNFSLILLGLSLSSLFTEILFVFWFKKNTEGPEKGIYFVSDDERHKPINRKTLYIFLPQYLLFLGLLISGILD